MAGSPSYGFQESASAESTLGLSTPFLNNAGFSVYGDINDSASDDASVTPTSSLTTTQGMTQGGTPDSVDIGPSGGNLHPAGDGGTNLIVWTTIAGMVIALGLAIYATYTFKK